MTFRLRDGLSIGDQSVITYDGELIGNDFYYENTLPSVTPTLNLNFLTKKLDPRITFTRGSTATYTDQFGNIATAAANVPRFDHDPITGECKGLLIEESRTNLILNSANLGAWTQTRTTTTSDTIIAPDGTLTGDKLQETTATANSFYAYQSVSLVSGTTYTFSFYAKPAERNFVWVRLYGTGTWGGVVFNLTTGATNYTPGLTQSSTSTYVGNGWWRFTVTAASDLTGVNSPRIYVENDINASAYDGIAGYGVYVWGAQLEVGSFATSYIPTTATTAIRALEYVTVSGSKFTSWYNYSEGSVLADYTYNTTASNSCPLSFDDTTSANAMIIAPTSTTDRLLATTNGGSQQFNTGFVNYTPGVSMRRAFAYKTNDIASTSNKSSVVNLSSFTPPNVTQLCIGHAGYFISSRINGTIKQIRYYPKRLTNAELQAITL